MNVKRDLYQQLYKLVGQRGIKLLLGDNVRFDMDESSLLIDQSMNLDESYIVKAPNQV